MHKICVALNKEKDTAPFRHRVTMRTIRTMTSYIYIVHYCIGLLAFLTIENLLGAIEFMGISVANIYGKYYHIAKESFG